MIRAHHIVNVSGGKDSTACYLLALERGRPFRAVMCDTGHESPVTMDYVSRLHEATGGPPVEIFRADFSRQIEGKRRVVETKWRREGVPEAVIERALAVLVPRGNPFLDLCIWKGRFPSRRAQFCTEELKRNVSDDQVVAPIIRAGAPVVQWVGVRRDESANRANTPMFRRFRHHAGHPSVIFAPIIHWKAEDCFAIARRHGVEPNPLYLQGMGRVGCFPCVNCSKGELAQIAARFPEAIEIVAEWEAIVTEATKRSVNATFFAAKVTPEGARLARENAPGAQYPGIRQVAEWARTDRGGRQFNWLMLDEIEGGETCSSQYGLCE